MGENSSIEWTHHTFSPWWGCAKVSPACDHCYAERWARRVWPKLKLWDANSSRLAFSKDTWNNPFKWNRRAAKTGIRERVFCASMSDVFDNHDAVTDERERLWEVIRKTPGLDWLLLTKRIGNVPRMLPKSWGDGWPNVWLGISVCNQEEADRDIPKLLALPARARFLSCEPLLGPISFVGKWIHHPDPAVHANMLERLDWIIVGGESGHDARPMHPEWARSLRDQCVAVGVPYFFKQWGEWWPISQMPHGVSDSYFDPKYGQRERDPYDTRPAPRAVRSTVLQLDGSQEFAFPPGAMTCFKVGKKAAGRLLDGRTWDEFPTVPA